MSSILVFPPGFRITETSGSPVSGAQIRFFEAGTSTPKIVYSDAELTQELGTVVYTRSDGLPVAEEESSTVVLVYTGEDAYKIDILRSDDTTLYPAQDDVVGAPTIAIAEAVAPFVPVITTGSPVTLAADDRGTLYIGTSNVFTLPTAATLGDGWHAHFRNGHSSGRVEIAAVSGISYQSQSLTSLYLEPGQAVSIACDGTAYRVYSDAVIYTPAGFRPNTPGVIMIADRITAAPSTSVGARYIVSSSYGSFSTHDVVEEVASGVFRGFTPTTDCGWLAYVQDEDAYYAFIASAWRPVAISISGLTADTAPDSSADYVATFDDSATSHKKVLLGKLGPTPIASGSISAATTNLDIALGSYDMVEIDLINLEPSDDAAALNARFSQDSGSNYLSGAADYSWLITFLSDSALSGAVDASDSEITVASTQGNAAGEQATFRLTIYRPAAASFTKTMIWHGHHANTSGDRNNVQGNGKLLANTDAITHVRFFWSAGTYDAGYYAARGYRF